MAEKVRSIQEEINYRFILYLALAADVSRNEKSFNSGHPGSRAIKAQLQVYDALAQPMLSELYVADIDYTQKEIWKIMSPYYDIALQAVKALTAIDKHGHTAMEKFVNKFAMMGYLTLIQSCNEIVERYNAIHDKITEGEEA